RRRAACRPCPSAQSAPAHGAVVACPLVQRRPVLAAPRRRRWRRPGRRAAASRRTVPPAIRNSPPASGIIARNTWRPGEVCCAVYRRRSSVVRHPPEAARGERMQLYNTLNRRLEPFAPTGPHVGIYVCGVTPYDTTHLGHARCYVVFDLLQR